MFSSPFVDEDQTYFVRHAGKCFVTVLIIVKFMATKFMATKISKVVTYDEGLQPIKLHNSTIMWWCEVTWQIKKLYLHFQ